MELVNMHRVKARQSSMLIARYQIYKHFTTQT